MLDTIYIYILQKKKEERKYFCDNLRRVKGRKQEKSASMEVRGKGKGNCRGRAERGGLSLDELFGIARELDKKGPVCIIIGQKRKASTNYNQRSARQAFVIRGEEGGEGGTAYRADFRVHLISSRGKRARARVMSQRGKRKCMIPRGRQDGDSNPQTNLKRKEMTTRTLSPGKLEKGGKRKVIHRERKVKGG